jgi:hypothetical protein
MFGKGKGKCKVVHVLSFNWTPRPESVLGEWTYSFTHSLTSALDRGEWSASRPGPFTPRERDPGTHRIGGWVGSRAGLDAVVFSLIVEIFNTSLYQTFQYSLLVTSSNSRPEWPIFVMGFLAFMKKLRENYIQGMLITTVQFKIVHLPIFLQT